MMVRCYLCQLVSAIHIAPVWPLFQANCWVYCLQFAAAELGAARLSMYMPSKIRAVRLTFEGVARLFAYKKAD